MKQQGLTAKEVYHMKADRGRRVETPAGSPRGLYLVLHPTGRKSWAFRYRWHGKPAKLTFRKPYPEMSLAAARAEAEAAVKDLERGIDPAASQLEEEQREPGSAAAVAEEWLARDVRPRTRTWAEVERVVKKEILPICKRKLITEIGRADVLRLVDSIVDRGAPIAANETLSILKRWFNWCVSRGYLEASPAAPVKPPGEKKSRDHVLAADELAEVWTAADRLGYPQGPFLGLLILTAQRRGEVAGMRWQDVDLEGALWTLSAEQTKAQRIHDVPLSPPVVDILRALPRFTGPFVFTSTGGTKPINGFSKCKARLNAQIVKARKDAGNTAAIADFTIHDLRRTAATQMAKNGVPPHVLSALLNHSPSSAQGVTSIYNRFRYVEERRVALENWATFVTGLSKAKARRAS